MNDQSAITVTTGQPATSRRGVLRAAAWVTPAVVVATAAPAFAGSNETDGLSANITPQNVQGLIDTALQNGGVNLPGYQKDGIPRCVPVDMDAYGLYFTATKNGAPAYPGTITFSLSGGATFVNPAHNVSGVAVPTNSSGQAAPPAFQIPANAQGPFVLTAQYGTKSEPITLPVSSYDLVCSLPAFP